MSTRSRSEATIAELLPDTPYIRAVVDDVDDACRADGTGAAWGKLVSLVMYDRQVPQEGVPPAAVTGAWKRRIARRG